MIAVSKCSDLLRMNHVSVLIKLKVALNWILQTHLTEYLLFLLKFRDSIKTFSKLKLRDEQSLHYGRNISPDYFFIFLYIFNAKEVSIQPVSLLRQQHIDRKSEKTIQWWFRCLEGNNLLTETDVIFIQITQNKIYLPEPSSNGLLEQF